MFAPFFRLFINHKPITNRCGMYVPFTNERTSWGMLLPLPTRPSPTNPPPLTQRVIRGNSLSPTGNDTAATAIVNRGVGIGGVGGPIPVRNSANHRCSSRPRACYAVHAAKCHAAPPATVFAIFGKVAPLSDMPGGAMWELSGHASVSRGSAGAGVAAERSRSREPRTSPVCMCIYCVVSSSWCGYMCN